MITMEMKLRAEKIYLEGESNIVVNVIVKGEPRASQLNKFLKKYQCPLAILF